MTVFIFLVLIASLFIISRMAINELFHVLRLFIRHEKVVFVLVTLIFFPGTLLHETAHFIMAIALMLRVRDMTIFPSFHDSYIKLGSVVYEKKDYIRGILVGIAPIFAGLFFFWFVGHFQLFSINNVLIKILIGYLVFVVSSTMFSSKQDLVDAVFIIPFVILIAGIIYVFNIKFDFLLQNKTFVNGILSFIGSVNSYLLFTVLANVGFVTLFKLVRATQR